MKQVCSQASIMPCSPVHIQPNHEGLSSAVTRIEVLDDAMAEVLRHKTPAERLAIGFGLWRSARTLLRGQLTSLHPEWSADRLDREVARRLSDESIRHVVSEEILGALAEQQAPLKKIKPLE